MLHPVPFEGNLKNAPPPHPGEGQSSKRAKINEDLVLDVKMEADQSPESDSIETHASESFPSEMVPESPLLPDPLLLQDIQMGGVSSDAVPQMPSFKDKLLNAESSSSGEEEEDISLNQGDVSFGLNRQVPTVDFASHIIDTLNKKMGLTVVVKLLGRKIGYRHLRSQLQSLWKPSVQLKLIDLNDDCFLVRFQDDLDYQNALLTGPWMIFGYYLTVQPWTPSFKPQDHVVKQVIGWVRLPKLPTRYYHKSIIRSIGAVFGEVVRVDYNTDSGERGKFVRIAVVIDLTKPLISKIQVDGEIIFVEYEGLPSICFDCGKYGHLQASCSTRLIPATGDPSGTPSAMETNVPLWMQVQRRRRTFDKGNKSNVAPVTSGNRGRVNGSRYEVLGEALEEDRPATLGPVNGHYPLEDPNTCRAKVKETKGLRKSDTVPKPKAPSLLKNSDSVSPSQQYVVKRAESSLDQITNSTVRIVDPRLPRSNQASKSNLVGLGQTTGGKDLRSKESGIKLSSGVSIPSLGSGPIEKIVGFNQP
ncbi:hypothetical protein K1719_001380 [Acacia pycnantha]|nr:hypothetical protein K1719_001380 [Acacia pycnantha]